ncbi:MAG: LacI family DNA-binding transcriptional regulator [Kordiimonadaceae bacterium]|nr:LacI family DNA-binding transcriptional regulator [Kordiimonadaceae bacterium]MBO6567791.1 LacI family DNA-binding transcriptional regulator [Kordiimonadaceae bacterium]MBO6962994.1 LacI family DNA-binding transcriptional regulator [Kordiimonadaceae bacterium]
MATAATINDVAKMAGVSIKTVSRVVNREPNVREKTRDLVLQAIQQLNYKPSLAARGLAGGRSFLIGMMYDNASDSFLVDLQRGILRACRERHYGLALCPASRAEDRTADLMEWVVSTQPDGIILTPPLSDDQSLVDRLIDANVTFISVSSTGTGLGPSVLIDEVDAARSMAQHLIDAGYQDIGFIKGPADHACSDLRFRGFEMAMNSAGLPVNSDWVKVGEFDFDSGVAAAEQMLKGPNRPTAIFASNDDMAAGVINVAYRSGLNVPKDLAVAGFDDTPLAQHFWPGLSTVKQPIIQIGQQATEYLMGLFEGPPSGDSNEKTKSGEQSMVLPYELVLRGSTGA